MNSKHNCRGGFKRSIAAHVVLSHSQLILITKRLLQNKLQFSTVPIRLLTIKPVWCFSTSSVMCAVFLSHSAVLIQWVDSSPVLAPMPCKLLDVFSHCPCWTTINTAKINNKNVYTCTLRCVAVADLNCNVGVSMAKFALTCLDIEELTCVGCRDSVCADSAQPEAMYD